MNKPTPKDFGRDAVPAHEEEKRRGERVLRPKVGPRTNRKKPKPESFIASSKSNV